MQQHNLEKYIIDLLGSINVIIQSYDIAAVHRIGKSNKNNCRNVIVRFTNRKNVILSLKNRRKLKTSNEQYKRIFVFENLCPTYKKLFGKLREMKKNDEIFNAGHLTARSTLNSRRMVTSIKYIISRILITSCMKIPYFLRIMMYKFIFKDVVLFFL